MTTWTPATKQAETWTSEAFPKRVFSPLAFSRAIYAGKTVFAIGSPSGIWTAKTVQAETWLPE